MSPVVAPVPGVRYIRVGSQWEAPGRPPLPGIARELLQWGEYLPDGSTTGLLDPTVLVQVSGPVTYDVADWAGATISNRHFLGKVSIIGSSFFRLRFKNCLFNGPGSGQEPIVACTAAGVRDVVFEDCEMVPSSLTTGTNCISGHHFTLRRVNAHDAVDIVGIINAHEERNDVLIEASWLHDLVYFSPDPYQASGDTHDDLIQIHGKKGVTIRGCRLEAYLNPAKGQSLTNRYAPSMTGTSVLMVNQHTGVPGDIVFTKNWADGGACGLNLASAPNMTDVGEVTDNQWGRGFRLGPDFAVLANTGDTQPEQTFTLTGNTRWDDGTPFNVRKKGD